MSNSAGSSISAVNSYSSTSDTSFIAKRKQALRYKKRREARNPKASRRGIFQCSFCMADFVNTGNLHRHEREVHLTVERFVCEPYSMENVRGKFCPYCGKPFDLVHDPTRGEYVDQYGCGCGEAARLCANKPLEERTFTRKDHFIQHLKCIHGISQWPEGFDAWSKSVSSLPQTSRCGFCGSTFNDWNERKAHIVSHYRSGMKMEQWEGDWGLTPEWERLLQQAIPPRDRADVKLYAKKQPWWKPQSGGVSTWLEQVYPPEL